jgi:hypothetical protein
MWSRNISSEVKKAYVVLCSIMADAVPAPIQQNGNSTQSTKQAAHCDRTMRVKADLSLNIKQHAKQIYVGVCLNLSHFVLRQKAHGYQCIVVWAGPKTSLNTIQKRKTSVPAAEQTQVLQVVAWLLRGLRCPRSYLPMFKLWMSCTLTYFVYNSEDTFQC